jgi:hypothetical protein
METIACFVARTRGPVVPFVDDWYPWAYAHHYLRTEIENMPLELGRVLSSVRVDDAVAIIHGWCAATGEDVDEAVHLLADAYLERWGLAPPHDAFAGDQDSELDMETDLDPVYADDDVYGVAREDVYASDDDPYDDQVDDPTQIIPVVRERFVAADGDPDRAPAMRPAAKKEEAPAEDRKNGERVNGERPKPDRSKPDRSKPDRPARTPRPVKAADRALTADQILAADQALVAEHPLVTGRSLAARR